MKFDEIISNLEIVTFRQGIILTSENEYNHFNDNSESLLYSIRDIKGFTSSELFYNSDNNMDKNLLDFVIENKHIVVFDQNNTEDPFYVYMNSNSNNSHSLTAIFCYIPIIYNDKVIAILRSEISRDDYLENQVWESERNLKRQLTNVVSKTFYSKYHIHERIRKMRFSESDSKEILFYRHIFPALLDKQPDGIGYRRATSYLILDNKLYLSANKSSIHAPRNNQPQNTAFDPICQLGSKFKGKFYCNGNSDYCEPLYIKDEIEFEKYIKNTHKFTFPCWIIPTYQEAIANKNLLSIIIAEPPNIQEYNYKLDKDHLKLIQLFASITLTLFIQHHKYQRHYELLQKSSEILTRRDELFDESLNETTMEIANHLQTESLAVFFRMKNDQCLYRHSMYINGLQDCQNNKAFDFDRIKTPTSKSLTYSIFNRQNQDILNLDEEEIINNMFVNMENKDKLERLLPRNVFKHLLCLPIIHEGRTLGVIRAINHISSGTNNVSAFKFNADQDVKIMKALAIILGMRYSNYRRRQKYLELISLPRKLASADSFLKAIELCMENITSKETGFTLCTLRKYEADKSSKIIKFSPNIKDFINDMLHLKNDEGLMAKHEEEYKEKGYINIFINKENYHYHSWAKKHNLVAIFSKRLGYQDAIYDFNIYTSEKEGISQISESLFISICEMLQMILIEKAPGTASGLIKESDAIRKLVKDISLVARTDSNILLTSENGVNKQEIVDNIIQNISRNDREYVQINCKYLKKRAFEPQLFGYENKMGSDPGKQKKGLFEQAAKGIIFLDNIDEISPSLQNTLFQVIDKKMFKRVGGAESIDFNARIISGTTKNLREMVDDDLFREDLYFKLCESRLIIPALRERRNDIKPLAQSLINTFNKENDRDISLDSDAIEYLVQYNWPGNFQELNNVITNACSKIESNNLTSEDLPEIIRSYLSEANITDQSLEGYIGDYIRRIFSQCSSIKEAAAVLNISSRQASRYKQIHSARTGHRKWHGEPGDFSLEAAKVKYIMAVTNKYRKRKDAARVLDISERQLHRYLQRFSDTLNMKN